MTEAVAAVFKISTRSPQSASGSPPQASLRSAIRVRKATVAKRRLAWLAAGRVAGIETRAATGAGGEVIELELGITRLSAHVS
jgi:hypothetical protein